jgi:hypothetical protein
MVTSFSGPTWYTLCTIVVDLDEETMTIYRENPKDPHVVPVVLPLCCDLITR